MKIRFGYLLFLSFITIGATSLVRAEDPITELLNALRKFTAERPQEKVHLHFDKPYYAAGDTIWYKAYVVDAKNNIPSNLSRTLNINLVNDRDSVVFAKKIPLKAGLGQGDFALPLTLKKGSYVIYASTNWMRNFDADFFFKKTIRIENPFAPTDQPIATVDAKESAFTVFPEGGELVNGIRSRVAFKYQGPNGLGKKINGSILNKTNEKIIEFESNELGMGIFALAPIADEVYTAVYIDNGAEKKVKLPLAKVQGYVLSVNNTDSLNLSIKVAVSPALINEKELYLIAQSNGEINYAAKIAPQQVITTNIPKEKFPTGILQVTLFNAANLPLAERLVFINHHDQLELKVATSKQVYAKREQVSVKVNVPVASGESGYGSYSVAVVDETKVPANEMDETSILSNLLLTSDLKGYVEKPNYYFFNSSAEVVKNLDYLMLTQGWRRFKWTEVLTNPSIPLSFKAEKGIDISGRVTTNSGQPIVGGKVLLFSGKAAIFSTDTVTNQKGEFAFDEIGFADSTNFGLQARNANDKKNVKIVLNQTPAPTFKTDEMLKFQTPLALDNYLANSKQQYQESFYSYNKNKELQLKQVEIKGQKKIPGIERSTNLNGPGRADKVITAAELTASIDLFQYLKNYVLGVVEIGDSVYFNRNLGVIAGGDGPSPIQFVMNGTFVTQDFVKNMTVDEIEVVEVLRTAGLTSVYGLSGGMGGVIVVTTKQGKERAISQYAPGIVTFMPKGYDITREFYSPKYSPTNPNPKPDLRSTIYWNANVVTDAAGNASFSYYNADGIGNYKITIEGVNVDGKLGRKVLRYEVR